MLGWVKEDQRIHIKHGLYRFKDAKMSTRKGNTIWLEDVLKEAEKRALDLSSEKNVEIAKKVAVGAIKWNDLRRTSSQDIVFDWDEILNMQGDSGPYIQYGFARTQSVLFKAKCPSLAGSFKDKKKLKFEPEETSLLRAISRFPEAIVQSGESFAPNILCNYLFDLTQKFNLFYQKHKILQSKIPEQRDFRLELTAGTGQIIKNGLNLLGISAPEKM
jgi:arginyl-tRNA synthetase